MFSMGISDIIQNYLYSSNSPEDYLVFLGIFFGLFVIFMIFDLYVINILKKLSRKTKIGFDDVVFDFLSGIKWPFYAYISLFIGSLYLELPILISSLLRYLLVIVLAVYAVKGLTKIIDHFLNAYSKKKKAAGDAGGESMINVLKFLARLTLWIVAFLMVLSNFGVEITPLIASLGVGGIAVALALQSVLGDLFGAFAIYFDKPFKEGDFIIVGDEMGTVKHIGIKTTRIEALGGQEIVISNQELTNSRVNNYKKMNKRRIVFSFGVEYGTPLAKLKKIDAIVEKIMREIKNADLDRVHFKEFGDSSLNYEVVYYVNTNDYNKYMDIQQEINFNIVKAFEKEKISMAFPTRTVHLFKEK